MRDLRDRDETRFEELIDLVVSIIPLMVMALGMVSASLSFLHLLSIKNNWRLRVRVFAEDDDFPVVALGC